MHVPRASPLALVVARWRPSVFPRRSRSAAPASLPSEWPIGEFRFCSHVPVCDEHLLETTFQRATPPRLAIRTCHSGNWRRVWLSLCLPYARPSAALACRSSALAAALRRRLERWRSAGARREVLAVCAAPSFSFVCTQPHRELTHSPCFVSARKQRAGVMNCCDERHLFSVVTRVENHRARGGSRSGDGVGRGFPISSVVVKVLSGFVAFVHFLKKL